MKPGEKIVHTQSMPGWYAVVQEEGAGKVDVYPIVLLVWRRVRPTEPIIAADGTRHEFVDFYDWLVSVRGQLLNVLWFPGFQHILGPGNYRNIGHSFHYTDPPVPEFLKGSDTEQISPGDSNGEEWDRVLLNHPKRSD